MPRNILVLNIANKSKIRDSLNEKIWVIVINDTTKIAKSSTVKKFRDDEIIKNQKENPAVIANDLNLGEDNSILNWVNECYKAALC